MKYSALSGNQLSLFKDFKAEELQAYITQLQAIKASSKGLFAVTPVNEYAAAIQGLEAKQAALLLSTQGLSNAQIAETLAINESNVAKNYQAMADAGLLKSKQSLTLAQVQENLQTVLGTEADTSAAMASLGLSAAIEGQEHQTVQLSAKKLQEAVATNILTEAQAQELAMRTGVIVSMNKQAAGTLPKWIATLKACTVAVWGQVKATAVWLATTPAGWATAAVAALGAVTFGLNEYAKSAKKASDHAIEVYEKSKEKIQSNKEEAQSLNDLIEKYKELESASDIDSDVRAEIKEIQYDIMDLTGAEADNLDLVNGKLDEQLDKLKAIQTEKSKQNIEDAKDAYYNALRVSDIMTGDADSYGNDVAIKWNGIEAGQIHKVNGFERINYKDFVNFITENGFGDIFRKNNNENIFSMKFVVDTTDIDSLEEKVARLKEFKEFLAENGLRTTGLYEGVTDAINRYEEQFDSEAEASKNLVNAIIDDLALSNEKLTEASVDSVEAFEKYRQMMIEEVQKDVSIGEMLADGILSEDGLETAVNGFMATAEEFSEWYELWKSEISESSELEEPKWDFSTTLENLDKVKESLDVLDKSFAKLFDKDESIGFEDLSSINEAFKDLDGIEGYIKRIQEAGQNTEEISQIFGELTGAYLEHAGVLANVTEENKELVIQMLEEMGIANAEEIVLAQLGQTTEVLALQKQFLIEYSHELSAATLEEITQFLAEADASDEAKQAIAQLALAKFDANNTVIDTSADIENVIALANAAGASATAIANFKRAMTTIENAKTKPVNGVGGLKQLDYATALKDSVENSTYDWEFKKLNVNDFKINSSPKYTPKYTGGSSTNKAIEQAKKDAEKEAKKAAKEAEKEFEKEIDFFERRVQVLSDAFQNLEKGMDNVFGADAKNALVTAQIGILDEEINNYTDALAMYRQKANEALSGVSDDLRDKIVNGAVQITDFIGDGNEDVVEAMEAYEGWADKVADCTQKLEELKTQIRQLELQKFNNIVEDFTNQFDIHGDAIDLIDKQIGLLEEAGQLIGESFYSKQIEQSERQLNTLETEKKRLVEQLNEALTSGKIQKGTNEWLEMVNTLSDVEGSILDCKTAIEEFDNELLNLNWQIFERIQTEFGNISSELNNLAGLFDDFNEIKVSDGKGTWTKQAITTLGLYAQQYELAQYQVGQYGEAIDRLNQDYAAGKYSATEYADKLTDLVKEQYESVNSIHAMEDSIVSLNETRVNEEIKVIEDEIDAYKKLTDAQIEALDAAKDLHDYEKSIKDKTKEIENLERQRAAMENDTSASAIAQKKKLDDQLAKAKQDLAEEEYQHSIETQKNALNQQYTAFEEERNKEIEALQLTLEDRETLIANSLEVVKANASSVGEQIALIAQEHGVIVSDAIISSWKSGENAIASYGAVLTDQSSAFIGNIMGVQEYVYGLQAQANSTADSLSWMFSTRADNLVNELTSSYYSEANLNAMTNTLQNSLINTLERGYNINGITSALSSIASGADSVASAANKAAQALASMGAAQNTYGSGSGSSSHGFKVYDSYTGKLKDTIYSDNQDYADLMKKYDSSARGIRVQRFAKGGIVSREKDSPLDDIAEVVGEEKLIAVNSDESVLTKGQTEAVSDLAKAIEDEKPIVAEGSGGISDQDELLTFEEFTALHNKNNPDVPFYPLQHSKNNKTGISNALSEMSDSSELIPASIRNMNVNIPEFIKTDRPNVNVRYGSMLTVNGDINDTKHFTGQIEKIADKCIDRTLEKINRDFVIHCR